MMRTFRNLLLIFLQITKFCLAIFSVLLTARLVLVFFGPILKQFPFYLLILNLARMVTISFLKVKDIKTPYGGFFEMNTLFTLLFFLFLEPLVERWRRITENWQPKRIVRE